MLDALDESTDLAPLAALLADPQIEVVVHAGRQDVALLRRCAAHRGHADLRHPDRSGLRRPLGAGRLRHAAARGARRARAEDRELHPLGPPPARRRAARLRARGRAAPARSRRASSSGGWRRRPPGLGARGVPLSRGSQRRPRSSTTSSARLPRSTRWRRAPARSPASSSAGARSSPSTRIGPSRPCSTTPRWSSSPSARRARQSSSSRSAASTRAACAGAAPTCSRRSLAARPCRRSRSSSSVTSRARPLDGPQIALAEALVRARALEAGLAYELIAARADLAAIVACIRVGHREPDVRTLTGWRREVVGDELLALLRGGRSVAVGADGRLTIGEPSAPTPES